MAGRGDGPDGPTGTGQPEGSASSRPPSYEPIVEDHIGPTFDQIVAPRYRGARRPRWLGLAIAAAVLLALGALAAALLMPRATVAVTLRTAPVSGSAILDVTADGQPLDGGATMAVAATPIEVEVAFSGSVPVSGTRAEPDATAAGTVRFANPAAEPVVVSAGTELTTGGGIAFLTDAEVTVPGADPATGQSGQADAAIRAAAPGTGGNVEVGEIGGRLPSGVYYSNREQATSGGTDREIPVVAAADLDALRAQADEALAGEATAAAQEQLGEGVEVLPGTVSVVASEEAFSAEEGAAAESVSLDATRTVRALAWSPEETLAQAGQLLAESPPAELAGQIPDGYAIDPASVRFGAPEPGAGSADGARVRLPVEAVAAPPFGPSQRRALAERLAGLDEAAAAATLAQEPAFAGSRLEFSPAWLPHRMPSDPARIEIEVEP